MQNSKKVLILGGGSGGLIAANLLAYFGGYDITVIDKNDTHYFQPGMLWIAFKGHSPERYKMKIERLLKPGIKFVNQKVTSINLEERQVETSSGEMYDYDYLIIALGVSFDFGAVEGFNDVVEKYGSFFTGFPDAERMWRNFSQMKEGKLVIAAADPLYKCPPAPHKAAFLAADTVKERGLKDKIKVVLAVPFIHEYSSETIAQLIRPKLEDAGIETITMFTTEKIDMKSKKIYSLEGDELDFDVVTVIPAHRGPDVSVFPDSVVDEDGYFKVDKHTLRLQDYDEVFAIGDCNNTPTSKTGVTAHLGAEVVAYNINGYSRTFTGRTNCPLVTNGEALFVISDYNYPPIPVKPTKVKRFLEDLFIASYWSSLKYPEKWGPIFEAYFKATAPDVLKEGGW